MQFIVEAGDKEYAIIIVGTEAPQPETYAVSVADLSQTVLFGATGEPLNKIHAASGITEWPIAFEKGVEKVLALVGEGEDVKESEPEPTDDTE